MAYHEVVAKIRALLDEKGITYKTFEHAPVKTSQEAAALRPEYSLHQGAKAMIVRIKTAEGKKFVMLIVPGDMRFNESKVKAALGAKEIRFALEPEVLEITGGVLPGGVPPFGNLFGLQVYTDPQVLANEEIIFNAGDRAFSIAMRSSGWKILVNPTVIEIV